MTELRNTAEHPMNRVTHDPRHREHNTPIRKLLNQRSMQAIGKAFDRGIVK